MRKVWAKWVAFAFTMASLISFLFLPLVTARYGAGSVSLIDVLSNVPTEVAALALALLLFWYVIMIICVLADARISAGIVCISGALYPLMLCLLTYQVYDRLAERAQISSDISIGNNMSLGIGPIFSVVFGITAAVFCFIYAGTNKIGRSYNNGYSQRSRNNYYQDQYQDQYQYPRRNQYSRQNQYSDQYSNQYSDQYSNENQYSNQGQTQKQNKPRNQYQSQDMGGSDW